MNTGIQRKCDSRRCHNYEEFLLQNAIFEARSDFEKEYNANVILRERFLEAGMEIPKWFKPTFYVDLESLRSLEEAVKSLRENAMHLSAYHAKRVSEVELFRARSLLDK